MQEVEADKKYRFLLRNGYTYNGVVLEIEDSSILIRDKFGNRVSNSKSMIEVLEEVGNND